MIISTISSKESQLMYNSNSNYFNDEIPFFVNDAKIEDLNSNNSFSLNFEEFFTL